MTPVSPIFKSPVFNTSPVPAQVPAPPIDANFATELLFLEMVNAPFLAAPFVGIGSDQLALLEAEQERMAQAGLATDLAANVNAGIGTNINPNPGTDVTVNPGPRPGTNPSPGPGPGPNVNPRPGTSVNMVA